jgi:uncharacterized protein
VTKKLTKRVKHVPQRTCVGGRQVLPKRTLIRVVRSTEGVRIDQTGKAAGRGAYLHDRKSCWERGLKGGLAHALKTEISDQDRELLRSFMISLPEDAEDETAQEPVLGGAEVPRGSKLSNQVGAMPDTEGSADKAVRAGAENKASGNQNMNR